MKSHQEGLKNHRETAIAIIVLQDKFAEKKGDGELGCELGRSRMDVSGYSFFILVNILSSVLLSSSSQPDL